MYCPSKCNDACYCWVVDVVLLKIHALGIFLFVLKGLEIIRCPGNV